MSTRQLVENGRAAARRLSRQIVPETMSVRARMVLAALVVGGFAILAASLGAYLASRNALINSVNGNLQQTAREVLALSVPGSGPQLHLGANGVITGIYPATAQYYPSGTHLAHPVLPVSPQVEAVAAGRAPAFYADVKVGSLDYREYVTPLQATINFGLFSRVTMGALQVGAPLTSVNVQLGHLGLALLLVALAALTLAAVLGWLASRAAVEPLNELTATVEELARTTDVSQRLPPGGPDELGRLRRAFNRLLGGARGVP